MAFPYKDIIKLTLVHNVTNKFTQHTMGNPKRGETPNEIYEKTSPNKLRIMFNESFKVLRI